MDRRVVPITAALSITGALGGALAGGLAVTVAGLVYLHSLAPIGLHGIGAGVGAALGLLVWPALAWSLLRRVALGRAGLAVAIGAVLGGASGLLAGAGSVNPYEPFALGRAPVPQGAVGALAGAVLVAYWLHWTHRRRAKAVAGAA